MIIRAAHLTSIVFAAAALCGCGMTNHNLVGVWDIHGGPGQAKFTFQADGNFKTEATMPGRSSTVTGQYKLDGDKVTLITMQQRTATLKWISDNEAVMTGDDGKAMTLTRHR